MSTELTRYRKQFAPLGLQAWHDALDAAIEDLRTKIGTQKPTLIDAIQPLAPTQPTAVQFNVAGTTGVGFAIQILNPENIQPASAALARAKITKGPNVPLTPLFHNLQSAADTNFNSSSMVTDYGSTSQNQISIPGAGLIRYWRIRSSFDGQNWNAWQIFAGPTGPVAVTV